MSINSAMLAGSAGLRANSSALAAISDNITNVNTVGYKRLRNDFTALLNSQSSSATYNAGGVNGQSYSLVGEQGALQSSSVKTHLAISGDGFFVTRERAADAGASDPFAYTRAGQFSPDSDGYLRNVAGKYLYGWPVDDDGVVQSSPTDLTALQPVRVSGIGGAAEATTSISMSANLDAGRLVNANPLNAALDVAVDYAPTGNTSMAARAVNPNSTTGFAPDWETGVQIYDSQGGIRTVTFAFLKSDTPNEWHAEMYVDPSTDLDTGNTVDDGTGTLVSDGLIAAGIVQFTPNGNLDLTQALAGTAGYLDPRSITIGASTETTGVRWATGLGVAAQTLTLDVGGDGSPGGLTQYNSESELANSQVNGTSFGSLATVEVDEDGLVTALFTNGLSKTIYQVPIATFSNVNGLVSESGGTYRSGPNAGPLNMKEAGQAGAGVISSNSLEASTVDLAEEFSNLITTQRAYSASSKIITTADEMLAELINLKR